MSNENTSEKNYFTIDVYSMIKSIFSSGKNKNTEFYKVKMNSQRLASKDLRKILSIIAYIPPFWIIAMLFYSNEESVRFHINQGICLCFAFLALDLSVDIVNFIFCLISPAFIVITSLLYVAVDTIVLVYMIIGCLNAKNSRTDYLPFIGDIHKFI